MPSSSQASEERKKVGMLVPPPVLLITLVVACVLMHTLWLGWLPLSLPRVGISAVILVISAGLVIASGKVFQKAGTPVRPVAPAVVVVIAGPYRISRNPMYLGMVGILVGLAVLSASYCFALAALVFASIVHFGVVLPEERYLESVHGESYCAYKKKVRRWL